MEYGKHALADLYECDIEYLDSVDKIQEILETSCKEANLTVVESKFHKFHPIGISGICILSESHVTIHTWPEDGFVSIDAFTCGTKMNPSLVCNIIAEKLNSKKIDIKEFKRGKKDE